MIKLIQWVWNKKWLLILWGLAIYAISNIAYWAIIPNQSPYWTGFGEQRSISGVVPAKNLWDWLNLLIVPMVIAIGAWWLNKTEKQNERDLAEKRGLIDSKLAEDKSQEVILQSYLDHMTDLLLSKKLRQSAVDDEARSIARSRTITTLRMLDPIRKGTLLQFLREAGLINEAPVVNIKYADLSKADLQKANLVNASLRNVNFNEALMSRAFLFRANLSGATFQSAILCKAKLISTNLKLAQLNGADLTEADFTESDLSIANLNKTIANKAHFQKVNLRSADLTEANMQGVDLSDANLSMAKLIGVDLTNANLTRANFRGADLTNANLTGAQCDCADFSLANLTNANISLAQLSKAKSVSIARLPQRKD